MFSIKSLVARMFARPATPTAAVKRTRRAFGLESLESREVPAFITWVNGQYPGSGDGQFSNPKNWYLQNSGFGVRIPQTGDDVDLINNFNGGQLYGFHGDYNTIRLTSALNVTLDGDITTKRLMMSNGSFDQSSGYDISVTGTTVPDARFTHSFQWTGGSLKSSTSPAEFIVTGAITTALIAPANNGTVSTENNLVFDNQSTTTVKPGTVQFSKAAGAVIGGLATVSLDLRGAIVSFTGPETAMTVDEKKDIVLSGGGHLTATGPGTFRNWGKSLINNGGIFEVAGGATADIKYSNPNLPPDFAYTQRAAGSVTRLHAGSTIKANSSGVEVVNGSFIVVADSAQGETASAVVDGQFSFRGGTLSFETPANGWWQPNQQLWWTFEVTGSVYWDGGTYKPRVDFAHGAPDGAADLWWIHGNLQVGGNAAIAPVTYNYQAGDVFNVKFKRSIIRVDGAILGLNGQNPTAQLLGNNPVYQRGIGPPAPPASPWTEWVLIPPG